MPSTFSIETMKDRKAAGENVCLGEGKVMSKGKPEKTSKRAPLTCKTNKLNNRSENTSKSLSTNGQKSKQSRLKFDVFEDAASSSGRSSPPAAPPSSSEHRETQTESEQERLLQQITSAEEPSAEYWRRLAETRQAALEETLAENRTLHERLERLQEENKLLHDVVQQAEDVMASVKEWTDEQEKSSG